MAVIWADFILELSQFLSSKKSSGAQETGSKLAGIYIKSLKTAQTPTGNIFNFAPGEEPLKLAFGAVFEKLSKSNSPTSEEKSKDPAFEPAPEEKIPSGAEGSKEEEEKFKDYLRRTQPVKFRFYELKEGGSEYVLETEPSRFQEVLDKRGKFARGKIREEIYNQEKAVYGELQKKYFEDSAKAEEEKTKKEQKQQKKEKDPYDDLANAIVAFWLASGPVVFSPLPPVPPTTLNTPGTFTILYPGNPFDLADGLRRAFNLGLDPKFKEDPTGILSATAISQALAVVLAKHLLTLKFVYLGATPASPAVGIVTAVF